MPSRKPPRLEKTLTEVELELMTILWKLDGGTVNEVLGALPRPLAYTSVATILRILEQKGVLGVEKIGRGHRYVPLVAQDRYQGFALDQMVGKVFGGEPVALVRRLVDADALSRGDLAALKALIDAKEKTTASEQEPGKDKGGKQ
jgi:BlaI family transcriptional regulator, penicillinase repressor